MKKLDNTIKTLVEQTTWKSKLPANLRNIPQLANITVWSAKELQTAKKWSNSIAENMLKSISSVIPIHYTTNSEYVEYALITKNNVWIFFHDHDVYTVGKTSFMSWHLVNSNTLGLYSHSITGATPDYEDIQILIKRNGSSFTITNTGKTKEKFAKPTEGSEMMDKFQTILDWAGFIPGFGDVADIANAGISWYRGNKLEALFSIIAVIPVVGSIIALPLKGVAKGLKFGGKLTGNALSVFWKKALPELPAGLVKQLPEAFTKFSKSLSSTGKTLAEKFDAPFIKEMTDDMTKFLDDSVVVLEKQSPGSKFKKFAKDAAIKSSGNVPNSLINNWTRKLTSLTYKKIGPDAAGKAIGSVVSDAIHKIPNGIPGAGVAKRFGERVNNILRSGFGLSFPKARVDALYDAMKSGYEKSLRNDPDKFNFFMKQVKTGLTDDDGMKLLKNKIEHMMRNKYPNPDDFAKAMRRYDDPKSLRNAYDNALNHPKSPFYKSKDSFIDDLIDNYKTNNKGGYDQFIKEKMDHALANDDPFFNMMLTDPSEKLKTLFNIKDWTNFKKQQVAAFKDAQKYYDIAYNEIQDAISQLPDSDPAHPSIGGTIKNAADGIGLDTKDRKTSIYRAIVGNVKQKANPNDHSLTNDMKNAAESIVDITDLNSKANIYQSYIGLGKDVDVSDEQ